MHHNGSPISIERNKRVRLEMFKKRKICVDFFFLFFLCLLILLHNAAPFFIFLLPKAIFIFVCRCSAVVQPPPLLSLSGLFDYPAANFRPLCFIVWTFQSSFPRRCLAVKVILLLWPFQSPLFWSLFGSSSLHSAVAFLGHFSG